MARQTGKEGVIQIATVGVGRLTDWEADWQVEEIEATEMGSDDVEFDAGMQKGKISVSGYYDESDAGQEDIYDALDGTKVAINIYPTGSTATGQKYIAGASMLVSNLNVAAAANGYVQFKFTASGKLTRATVA